jgi:hypothetical protein
MTITALNNRFITSTAVLPPEGELAKLIEVFTKKALYKVDVHSGMLLADSARSLKIALGINTKPEFEALLAKVIKDEKFTGLLKEKENYKFLDAICKSYGADFERLMQQYAPHIFHQFEYGIQTRYFYAKGKVPDGAILQYRKLGQANLEVAATVMHKTGVNLPKLWEAINKLADSDKLKTNRFVESVYKVSNEAELEKMIGLLRDGHFSKASPKQKEALEQIIVSNGYYQEVQGFYHLVNIDGGEIPVVLRKLKSLDELKSAAIQPKTISQTERFILKKCLSVSNNSSILVDLFRGNPHLEAVWQQMSTLLRQLKITDGSQQQAFADKFLRMCTLPKMHEGRGYRTGFVTDSGNVLPYNYVEHSLPKVDANGQLYTPWEVLVKD